MLSDILCFSPLSSPLLSEGSLRSLCDVIVYESPVTRVERGLWIEMKSSTDRKVRDRGKDLTIACNVFRTSVSLFLSSFKALNIFLITPLKTLSVLAWKRLFHAAVQSKGVSILWLLKCRKADLLHGQQRRRY